MEKRHIQNNNTKNIKDHQGFNFNNKNLQSLGNEKIYLSNVNSQHMHDILNVNNSPPLISNSNPKTYAEVAGKSNNDITDFNSLMSELRKLNQFFDINHQL